MVALVSERTHPFRALTEAWTGGYREQVMPLSRASEEVCPWKDVDVKAWRALSSVPQLSERAGIAIVRSIIGSVADPAPAVDGLPELSFDSGSGVDLRPYLCDSDGEERLLARLGGVLDEVGQELEFPDWHWNRRADIAALPAQFRRCFLWGLHLAPWSMVRVTLTVYDQLELEQRHDLRFAIARLLSLAERKLGIAWCEVIGEVDPDHRARAAELILETRAYAAAPCDQARRHVVASDWAGAIEALSLTGGG